MTDQEFRDEFIRRFSRPGLMARLAEHALRGPWERWVQVALIPAPPDSDREWDVKVDVQPGRLAMEVLEDLVKHLVMSDLEPGDLLEASVADFVAELDTRDLDGGAAAEPDPGSPRP